MIWTSYFLDANIFIPPDRRRLGAKKDVSFRLVNQADVLETGLDDQSVIQTYEILYYLYRTGDYDKKGLKALYKYCYRLTQKESVDNPEWGEFVAAMDSLYSEVE